MSFTREDAWVVLRRKILLLFLSIIGGQVLSSLIDAFLAKTRLGWRYMLGLAGIPAFIQLIGLVFLLKESPRYLVQEGRHKEAESVFERIYGFKSKQDASALNLVALSQVQKAMEVHIYIYIHIYIYVDIERIFIHTRC